MLNEFRVGASKADLVILNGTGTVYEIKSDRDSLARLMNQLDDYRKVFAKIYVIAGDAHIREVMQRTPSEIGVMSLARWNRIQTIREAEDRPDLVDPLAILDSLRSSEASLILERLHLPKLDVPNTALRTVLKEIFAGLDPATVHREMVATLKQTRDLAPLNKLVANLPHSLQAAALSLQIRRGDHERVLSAVGTPLS